MTLPTSRNIRTRRTIGRDVDVLADIGAVEDQRIGAGLTFDDVAAVARVPDERVVAVAEKGHVVAATADHGVVAVAAEQHVVALASGDGVVAGTAVDRKVDPIGTELRSVDGVVAAEAVDDQGVEARIGAVDRHLRGQSVDEDRGVGAVGDADVCRCGRCR